MNDYNDLKFFNYNKIASIGKDSWNNCVDNSNPFSNFDFLNSLEESGCISEKTGWKPFHLCLKNKFEEIIACTPMYFKNHSQGEYVFDHSWANAYENAGGAYYPKLLIAIPFTPVSGQRILIRNDYEKNLISSLILNRVEEIASSNNISSVHINFTKETENVIYQKNKFLERFGIQFHWKNNSYKSFNDFLETLSSRKRKSIIKERKNAKHKDIKIYTLLGDEIKKEHLESFYNFYIDTTSKKWGIPYLNYDFFKRLYNTSNKNMLLIIAKREEKWVAGALNFLGENTLFGRYWGCLEDHKFLHFEICYYQAIEFAIKRGLLNVEAGAQGPHKLSRGYLPQLTYSWHWINNIHLKDAIENFLNHEKNIIKENLSLLNQGSPYKKD